MNGPGVQGEAQPLCQGGGSSGETRDMTAQIHVHTGGGQITVGQQRYDVGPALLSGVHKPVEYPLTTPLADDRHTEPLAKADELLEQIRRLESLGHGQHGSQPSARPGAREVPIAHVTHGQHDRAPLKIGTYLGRHIGSHTRENLLLAHAGQGEGLVEVAHIGAHGLPGGHAHPSRSRGGGQNTRQVLLELSDSRKSAAQPVQPPCGVGPGAEQSVAQRRRQRAHVPPGEAVHIVDGDTHAPHTLVSCSTPSAAIARPAI